MIFPPGQGGKTQKNDLVQLGDRNIGRVPLSEFYKPALEGKSWQFMESVDYLRSLGALDETDPNLPSVIVPNYVGSQSNCVVSTSYYSVCCIDECEGLTSQLEKEFASPDADPKEVLSVVSGLSSSTVASLRSGCTTLSRGSALSLTLLAPPTLKLLPSGLSKPALRGQPNRRCRR